MIINLLDPRDIATNKAFVLGKRPKWRDYVDIFFCLKKQVLTFQDLVNLSVKKFKNDFSEKLFLEQLVYWNDIDSYRIEFLAKEVPPEEIKKFLTKEVEKFTSKIFIQDQIPHRQP